jgi:hypothetical protein
MQVRAPGPQGYFLLAMNRLRRSLAHLNGQLLLDRLPWVIIGLGTILRVAEYVPNRSLWRDEASLALNLTNRPLLELLLRPLDYNQGSPLGFLLIQKVAVQILGANEYALRLFPLICGIVSLFLFYGVAKTYIRPGAALVALSLFAILDPLVYYSSETKQYSSDVALVLLLFWLIAYYEAKPQSPWRLVLLGGVGTLAIWFSHPVIFMLGGMAVYLAVPYLKAKNWRSLARLSSVYLLWAASFVVFYFVSLRSLAASQYLLDYWSEAFWPLAVRLSSITWPVYRFFRIFEYPVGLSFPGLAAMLFVLGCISIWVWNRRSLLLWVMPMFLVLLASALHKYPFAGRLMLFVVPGVLLLIGEGAVWLIDNARYHKTLLGLVVLALLFWGPLSSAQHNLIASPTIQEVKPVMRYIEQHQQSGDLLYVGGVANEPFMFYAGRYGFHNQNYIVGADGRQDWTLYAEDILRLGGNKRVWLLLSIYPEEDKRFILSYLDTMGTRLDSFQASSGSVYLYDLSQVSQKARP